MSSPEAANDITRQLSPTGIAILGHISVGIEMIQVGDGKAAYDHFQIVPDTPHMPRLSVGGGMIFPVWQLQSESDLVSAASTVARHSRASQYGAEIGGWHIGDFTSTFNDDEKYFPEIVSKFHHEVGIIAAEEWIHLLQNVGNISLTGQVNREVDVAAYLAQQDIELSSDFLTRYGERALWHIANHPEDEADIRQFISTYHRLPV